MTVEPAKNFTWRRGLVSLFLGMLLLLVVAVLLVGFRGLAYQPFSMPSGSMKPTLLIGDYLVASKYAYGYSRHSLPFAPPSGRIFGAEPRYGDVVVFRLPRDPSTVYVKRVVGLPGDRIQMIRGVLSINGTAAKQEQIEDFVESDPQGHVAHIKRWRETLPNGASYETLDLYPNGFYDNTNVYAVPPGHYFMMGDNRDNSQDSRVTQFGYIPFENLVGRADRIAFSIDQKSGVRFERIGMAIR
jgi:signal peptidase I